MVRIDEKIEMLNEIAAIIQNTEESMPEFFNDFRVNEWIDYLDMIAQENDIRLTRLEIGSLVNYFSAPQQIID